MRPNFVSLRSRLATSTSMLAVAVFIASLVGASSNDWPGFRGPGGNGQLLSGLPAGDGELYLSVEWNRRIGSGYSGIALSEGIGVVATSGNDRDLLMAFEPATGAELWKADLGALTVGAAGSKDGPISTPAVGGGRVFMVSTQGKLQAHSLASGELLWSVHLVEDLESTRPVYGFSTSPVVVDDVVVVQAGGAAGSLVGFDASSGEQRWRSFRDRHYAQSPVVTELGGRRQVVTIGSTSVVGIDPVSGEELWIHEHGGAGEFGADSSSPMPVGDDRLFVKHDNERSMVLRIVLQEDESFRVDVVGVNRTMTRSYSPPTVWGETAYGYTSRFMSALDLESGKELWRSRSPGDGFPLAVDGYLFVATKNEGTVHLGVPNAESWSEVDRLDVFEDLVWTPPSYSEGAFYVRSLTEMARVDVRRRVTNTTDRDEGTAALPAELESLRQSITEGKDAQAEVAALLRNQDGPLISGERVLFLYQGEAEEVGIAGDMFGFRYDEAMQRLEGTDLWWWQTELDRRGRFNYVYFPDYEPTLDPLNPRSVESTVMGPDLNHRGETALQVSWFAMPDWPGNPGLAASNLETRDQVEPVAEASGNRGRVEQFEVEVELPAQRGPGSAASAAGGQIVSVPVTVWLPPGYDQSEERLPTVFSLERYALRLGAWPDALQAVVGAGRVRPLIGVMIDPPAGFYGRRGGGRVGLLMPQIVAEVDRRFRTIGDADGRAVVGALYTGPPALGLSLGEERLFSRVAIQSPFVIDVMLPMYRRQIEQAPAELRPKVVYFEWARWDMRSPGEGLDLGEFMSEFYDLLVSAELEVSGGEVWDSTDWSGWRNRTDLVLETLFTSEPGIPPSGLGPWLVDQQE